MKLYKVILFSIVSFLNLSFYSKGQTSAKIELIEKALKNEKVKEYFLIDSPNYDSIFLIDSNRYFSNGFNFSNKKVICLINDPYNKSSLNNYIYLSQLYLEKRKGRLILFQKESGVLITLYYKRNKTLFDIIDVKLAFF